LTDADYTRRVTVNHPMRVSARALLLGVVLLLVAALPAAAHAELESSDPADKAEVEAPFDGPIVLAYSEALAAGSKADLKGPDGSTVASATIDGDELVFTLDGALDLGTYAIQWTSVAADRDVLRGTLTFTVVAPPPTPTPPPTAAPTATPRVTPSPAVSPSPAASPTPSGGTPAGGSADVLFPLLAAVIAIGAIGAFLLRNRRSAGR
jgi:methionine-rich copper-binding protein CopC